MISIISNQSQTGIKRYVCDKKDELSSIDLRTTNMGSTCYVIKENKSYILDGEFKWVSFSSGSNSSSSGGSSSSPSDPEENTYIADGGEII